MTVHSFSSAAGAAAPLTRARVSGSLPVWSLSLGCPKNRVDTERLLGSLGAELVFVKEPEEAELVFINTCGFIAPAIQESVHVIAQAIADLEHTKEIDTKTLKEYADPDSDKYKKMVEEIRKRLHFTSLDFARLDELVSSIGLDKCKLCTYCWNGEEDDE